MIISTVVDKWGYPESDRTSALKRLARLQGRRFLYAETKMIISRITPSSAPSPFFPSPLVKSSIFLKVLSSIATLTSGPTGTALPDRLLETGCWIKYQLKNKCKVKNAFAFGFIVFEHGGLPMNYRFNLFLVACLFLHAMVFATENRPNIILIMVDELWP